MLTHVGQLGWAGMVLAHAVVPCPFRLPVNLQPTVMKRADKTFGMKNKSKSAKVQQYVKQLEASMKPSIKEQRLAQPSARDKKAAEEAKQKELNDLFAVAIKQPKVPAGQWRQRDVTGRGVDSKRS